MRKDNFQKKIYTYYQMHGRDLPWRKTRNPYHIFVSEIMLQQTQVESVLKKYPLFLKEFPSFSSLSRAPFQKILTLWKGLGYNRRALYLKRSAETITNQFRGRLPRDVETLITLPGVGRPTASAIVAFAFNKPVVFIETNIRRVFIHHFFSEEKVVKQVSCSDRLRRRVPTNHLLPLTSVQASSTQAAAVVKHRMFNIAADCRYPNVIPAERIKDKDILPLVEKMLDRKNPCEWYWALMDYGAHLKKKYPNPNRKSAHYIKQAPFEGSDRQIRGKILEVLIANPNLSRPMLFKRLETNLEQMKRCLFKLQKEGLVRRTKNRFTIA